MVLVAGLRYLKAVRQQRMKRKLGETYRHIQIHLIKGKTKLQAVLQNISLSKTCNQYDRKIVQPFNSYGPLRDFSELFQRIFEAFKKAFWCHLDCIHRERTLGSYSLTRIIVQSSYQTLLVDQMMLRYESDAIFRSFWTLMVSHQKINKSPIWMMRWWDQTPQRGCWFSLKRRKSF